MALTQITEKGIKDGELVNADVNASAAIAKSKLASLDIVNADVNASAAIAGSKLAAASGSAAGSMSAAHYTKVEGIAASANNYTHPNHSGDVTSSADGATTIADNAVTLAKMAGGTDGQIITYDASGDPVAVGPGTDGQVLTSTGAGSPPAFESIPASGIASLVADTSPQLGGDLDTNSFEIGLDDSHKVKFGDDNDLEIWHTGSAGTIKNITGNLSITNTGNNTIVNSDNITFQSGDQGETIARFLDDGACELWHDNTKQCETSANGLAFPSGKGIDFSAHGNAAGASSEVLDDYETGTWTITGDTPNFNGFGSVNCSYVKIGDLVFVRGSMVCLTNSSSTNFYIASLPFSVSGSAELQVMAGGEGQKALYFDLDGGTTGYLRDTGFTTYTYGTFSNDTMSFSGCYRSA